MLTPFVSVSLNQHQWTLDLRVKCIRAACKCQGYNINSMSAHGSLAVYLVLAAWVPVALLLFSRLNGSLAVVICFIGGWLFLPSGTVRFPYIFHTDKPLALCLVTLVSTLIFARRQLLLLRPHPVDLPILVWGTIPLVSSLLNGIPVADALQGCFHQLVVWGVPYALGRAYLANLEGMRRLALGIVVGGILYVPLCWFEIMFGPFLHLWLYGFYPSSLDQAARFGGWRPMVFMQHGLMVALWMASATVCSFWLWYSSGVHKIWKIPMLPSFVVLAGTTIALKSVNGWILVLLGMVLLWSTSRLDVSRLLYAIMIGISSYVAVRITGLWDATELVSLGELFGNGKDRSLYLRVEYERLIAAHAWERPLWGWGTFARAMVATDTGKTIVDSQWIGAFGIWGLGGLVSLFAALLLPLVRWVRQVPTRQWQTPQFAPVAALAIVLLMFTLDNMLNAMFNPIYMLAAGGLMGLTLSRLPAEG